MQARRSTRTVRKPQLLHDHDPDYETEDDDDEYYEPERKVRRRKRCLSPVEGMDETYVVKREKNNVAVRKSRMKLKNKHDEALDQIGHMAKERLVMEQDVEHLSSEITELKELLYRITSSQSCDSIGTIDLSKLRFFDSMK